MKANGLTGKKLLLITLTAILFAVALLHLDTVWKVVRWLFGIVSPVILGMCVAFVLNPAVRGTENLFLRIGKKDTPVRRRLARGGAILTVFVLVLGLLTLLIVAVVPQIRDAVNIVTADLPGMADDFAAWFNGVVNRFSLPVEPLSMDRVDWDKTVKAVMSALKIGEGKTLLGGAIGAATSIVGAAFDVLMGVIVSVYILARREAVSRFFTRLVQAFLPEKRANAVFAFATLTNTSFRNFVSGQLIEAVIIGVLCSLGMLLFRFPYAAATGAIVAVTALVPVFGAWIGGAVGALFMLTQSPMTALLFVVFLLVLQQLEGNLIYPKVVGTSMGLPGLLVMVAVLVGGRVGGVMGMLLGVPVCAILYALCKQAVEKRLDKQKQAADTPQEESNDA